MIKCTCPFCGSGYELEDRLVGRKLRCDDCDKAFILADASGRTVPVDAVAPAQPAAPAVAKSSGNPGRLVAMATVALVVAAGGFFIQRFLAAQKSSAPDYGVVPLAMPETPAPKRNAPPPGPPAERAANYEIALARAKESGKDIVVFQRGSDWNRLAETLYNTIWTTDDFAQWLGDKFILVAVDHPEVVGGRAVVGQCSAVLCGVTGFSNVQIGNPPPLRLAKLTEESAALPANEVTEIASADGVSFKPRAGDGAFLANASRNPGQDTLTLKLKTARGGNVVRIDFLTDTNLPGNGPGRASNGNFAISEVEIVADGKPVKIDAAWANVAEGATWGAWQTIDGISDKGDNLWNPAGNHHKRRTLMLAMNSAAKPAAEISVRLICKSQWGQHVPGCLRAAVLADKQVDDDVRQVAAAQLEQSKNSKFSWWDKTYCPRVALMDSNGCAVACENKPRLGLTAETLAARVKELRSVREKRDAKWAEAAKAQGPQKAELLRQSLELLGFANWTGNDNCYKPVHEEIRKADSNDVSGAVRWLKFSGDPKGGVPWEQPDWGKALAGKDLTDADYKEALARIEKELKDPRNRVLDHERIQRIMNAKYLVYKRWPNHQEQRFDVMREIAAFDPTTFWGIGATGYIGMHKRCPTPMLTYGWATNQVRPGTNVWDMTDTAYFFDHAGPYNVKLTFAGGKGSMQVKRIALLDGAKVLAEAQPDADLGPGHGAVEAELNFKDWRADLKATLRVEAITTNTDIAGNFSVEPQLLSPPPRKLVATPMDIESLERTLGDELLAEAAKDKAGLGRITSNPNLRLKLAQYETIRCCGADKVAEIAARDGGAAFLQTFFKDIEWMESFLGSDVADWDQSLENLRVLFRYGEGMDQLFHRHIATALALQWGKGNRYRLVDRFRHVQQAQREGLLHISFENLNVREMRWAIATYGTAKDYQFLLDDRQTTLGDYFGACWAVAYIDPNVFGDSVQGWEFATPWTHFYGTGTGNRPFIAQRQVGGVCGTLSGYGSAAAQAHGVPSVTVGQPGHCAYIIRVGQEWPVGYSVTWPTGASAPGWEGTGYSTLHRLYEPVEQDREHFLAAMRLTWLAHLQRDRAKPRVRIAPDLRYAVYRSGVGAGLPDFTKLVPETTGSCRVIDEVALRPSPSDNFGIVWEGKLDVAGDGNVRASTQSDDGSRIVIDGQPVVAANCSKQEKDIALTAGAHALRVEFSQGGGALNLAVGFEGVLSSASGDWNSTFEQAIAAQPTNYVVWLDYIRTLETVKDVPTNTWLDLGRRAAQTFACCNEAGWALTRRCLDKVLPGMKPEDRVALLLACNQDLRQENWYKPEGYPLDGNLNWQADRIGDPKLAVDFFGRLLDIHHSEKPDCNWIFGNVLNWGATRFAANPATATNYIKALYTFFKSDGDSLDKGLMAKTISEGIRKSSDSGDLGSFRLWTAMAANMLPPLKPEDVHLNAQQAAAVPKYLPFPGDLLSKNGLLRTSSASQFDKPFSYQQILTGGYGGWFDTNAEDKPWAQVQLAGDALLTGIVLVNRYEYAPTQDEFQWAVPLKVSVSTDGKAWTEVASFDKAESTYRIDLQNKNLRARYVRIERLPGKPQARFHFRNVIVYGQRLY